MHNDLKLENHDLRLNGGPLLSGLGDGTSVVADPDGIGVFLRFAAETPAARHVFPAGSLDGIGRFTCCHRYEPFWMTAKAGTRGGDVPPETQYLLAEREDGVCVLFVPLLDGAFRASLQGSGETGLELVAETGDPAVVGKEVVGLFVAAGPDPYALMERGARSVMHRLGTGRLRREKPLPHFVDLFGWCTWDAFYQEVSQDKVRSGLESFAEGGVTPRLLILDDGWQSVAKQESGETRLTAFAANEKFRGDLAPTVAMSKNEFGVEAFLVWHAFQGYWGGVDGDALPGYGVRPIARDASPGIRHHRPDVDKWWGPVIGVVAPEHVYRFYQDYHRHLRQQGVDGVKVDNQAALETTAAGFGLGRVGLMRAYHEALEGSAQTQFRGALINCMSCANEMLYGALNSTVTRTSTDFWPKKPESHGLHLYVNAQVSAWFGEFVHPDWDMFQSGHEMGAYHAAGRAVSGAPVYVSDKPGAHDFDLLRKLVLPDGTVLRCADPGRPTRDCLFHDVTREPVLLKIFNRNEASGVVGVFNARYGVEVAETPPVTGALRPADVEGLEGEQFAVYAHHARTLRVQGRDEAQEVTLPQLACEVFTVAPVEDGVAPIGLADRFNSGGAVVFAGRDEHGVYEVILQAGGRFLAWCERRPVRLTVDGEDTPFAYDEATRALEVAVPDDDTLPVLRLYWGA